jgi:acyl dehydratase
MDLKQGARFAWKRRITDDDILAFTRISSDRGRHHIEKDAQGRLLAQGLLAATMPTKLGGDLNFLARRMTFEFEGPVYGGDELECVGTIELALRKPGRWKVSFSFEVVNQRKEVVLKGSSSGVILDQP